MNRKIKLIWDFRGEDALQMAKHHCVHLQEFVAIDDLPYDKIDITSQNELFASAYVVIDESQLKVFKDALKPHRGLVV